MMIMMMMMVEIRCISVVDVEMMMVMLIAVVVSCWFPLFQCRKKYLSPSPAQRPTDMMGWPMI